MKNKILPIFSLLFFLGCASTSPTVTHPPIDEAIQKEAREMHALTDEELLTQEENLGIILGKTQFEGVLQKEYVKLILEDEETKQSFEMHIGSQAGSFPHGYFFVELPVGHYTISAISIPVATTTQATEKLNISFNVLSQKITYVGTLKIVGTKETIKLGGLPVIKPGFEYIVEILNEFQDARELFKSKFGSAQDDIEVELMQNNLVEKTK